MVTGETLRNADKLGGWKLPILHAGSLALLLDRKTGSFFVGIFVVISRLGGADNNEGLKTFGCLEGVYLQTGY